jgi:hypothetical protein
MLWDWDNCIKKKLKKIIKINFLLIQCWRIIFFLKNQLKKQKKYLESTELTCQFQIMRPE